MVTRKAIASLLEDYEDIVVATVCSHSSLQIFHGARQEGFRTLGIAIGQRPRFYDAFPLAKPDEFLIVDSYADILDQADDLVARQAVTVPHGSFVEYMGAEVFAKLRIPTFGNREVLRRDEANIDEMYKLGAQEALRKMGLLPTFVVTGNMPVVLRESLLPKAFEMGERAVERSIALFGGMIGPFCLETIVSDKLEFKVFEISTRIVAGTNLFVGGSPYADLQEPGMSTGRRIAREIRIAQKQGRLVDILS